MTSEAEASPEARDLELWRAELVCPVASPPIRNGAVLTSSGRIVSVGEESFIRPNAPLAYEFDFGRAILVPGLVNAHTHLELSGIQKDPLPMAQWIVDLVSETRSWPSHLFLASAQIGVAASLAAGVTCVGDISTTGESATAIADAGMRGVVFHEVLGIDPACAEEIFEDKLNGWEATTRYKGKLSGEPHHGLSPHAPYSTSLALYRVVKAQARGRGWPVATHLAESPEEVEFLETGGGPFAEMHTALESPIETFRPTGLRPAAHLDLDDALDGMALVIHANQTNEDDWTLLRRAGVSVCLCPRSAAFFGHPMADAAGMRRAGLRLCLGTDSRASSPSLSLLAEAAALSEADPELSDSELLRMCTLSGAEALGRADEGVGQLLPGGVADFAVVVPESASDEVTTAHLFEPGSFVVCTITGGEIRYRAELHP